MSMIKTAAYSLCLALATYSGGSLAADKQVITFDDGSQYKGEVQNGNANGQGSIQWPNGDRYTGQWQDNNPHGYGKKTFLDGSVYEGDFFNGVQQGKGTLTYPDGTTYKGDWKSGSPHGLGIFAFKNAGTYEGAVYLGLPHGKGTFSYSNGDLYDGQWEHGKRVGHGKLRYANGDLYIGTFVNGKPNGSGVFTYADGSRYKGTFADGKPHGDGTCYRANEQALCSYDKGHEFAYAVIPQYLNEPTKLPVKAAPVAAAPLAAAANTAAPAAAATPNKTAAKAPEKKQVFVTALSKEKEELKPTYAAQDLKENRSDILFHHNFEDLDLSNALRTGYWSKQASLFSDQLVVHARSGDLKLNLKVKRFKGPGTYRIKPGEIEAWFQGKLLKGLKDFANTLTIKRVEDGWIEGNINLSFQQKDNYGDYYKVENGVFRLNNNPIFKPGPVVEED